MHMLWNDLSVHCVNVCSYDWFKKQADQPITEQDKVRPESPTKNNGIRQARVRTVARETENKSDTETERDVKVMSLRAAHRLIEMG